MARVLVTGGAGFAGAVLVRRLTDAGHRVRIIDNLTHGGAALLGLWNREDVDIMVADISHPDARSRALDGIDAVVHLAAIVGDPACRRDPDLAWRVNLDATRDLVREARAAGAGRFVMASTCSNYGVSAPDALVDEESSLNPVSVYAESKVQAEAVVLDTAGPGFDPIVLRFSTLYGVSPRMRFDLLVNDFTREAVARRKIVIYGEQFWRPHLHVDDAARAIGMMVEAPADAGRPRVYNVGDEGQNFQKLAIARLAQEAVPGTELELVSRDEDPRSYRVRFDRIRERFGFAIGRTVPDGVNEVRRLLVDRVVIDYDDPRYVN